MKVQLVVVRGKPEGKVIPLVGPKFKIGRGETCHLRPNSEQVSREHAEFTIERRSVIVRDLGSRNGTLVNGKALTTEACQLKDRDLVQVGPLTFAVSILDAPGRGHGRNSSYGGPGCICGSRSAKASPDDVSTDDIDSWLVGANAAAAADQPTAVYGGDTITITRLQGSPDSARQPSTPPSVADDEIRAAARGGRQTGEVMEAEDEQAGWRGRPTTRKPKTKMLRTSPRGIPRPIQPLLRRQEGPERAGQAGRELVPASQAANSRTPATRPAISSAD